MEIELLNDKLLQKLHEMAQNNERLRQHYDLRTTPEDGSQRMLNVLQPGTKIPVHRHLKTAETAICIEGCIDWIFYEELPSVDTGGCIHNGSQIADESCFTEVARCRVNPREGVYGIQIPAMAWHTIEILEPSCIFEGKDGAYEPTK